MSRFTCHNCGDTWDDHPAHAVPCPICAVPQGSPCKRPSGHNTWGKQPHAEREQAAVDAGLLGMCREGPTAKGLMQPPPQAPLFDQLVVSND